MALLIDSDFRRRVVDSVRRRVAAGETSERAIAARTAYSQPHISHVLTGQRRPSAAVVDALVCCFELRLCELYSPAELAALVGRVA